MKVRKSTYVGEQRIPRGIFRIFAEHTSGNATFSDEHWVAVLCSMFRDKSTTHQDDTHLRDGAFSLLWLLFGATNGATRDEPELRDAVFRMFQSESHNLTTETQFSDTYFGLCFWQRSDGMEKGGYESLSTTFVKLNENL